MKSRVAELGRKGFTLIEVLVTLILLALLAAAVFPVVTQQTKEADPVRAANDLASIRTAVETFRLNVRPEFPGDLEDLVYKPATTTEESVDGTVFGASLPNSWKGPYLDAGLVAATSAQSTGNAIKSGFSVDIQNDLKCVSAAGVIAAAKTDCAQGTHFVAVKITGISASQFSEIDKLVDGVADDASGKFLFVDTNADATKDTGLYLAAPYF